MLTSFISPLQGVKKKRLKQALRLWEVKGKAAPPEKASKTILKKMSVTLLPPLQKNPALHRSS